jgi:hypothetical protein
MKATMTLWGLEYSVNDCHCILATAAVQAYLNGDDERALFLAAAADEAGRLDLTRYGVEHQRFHRR